MGACYSCQSRSGKQTYMYYASNMSLSSNQTPYSGVRRFSGPPSAKPHRSSSNNKTSRIRNSNEQLGSDEERTALVTITNGRSNLSLSNKKSRSQPSITQVGGSRFGFKPFGKSNNNNKEPRADSNSNVTTTGIASSVDSLDSYGPGDKGRGLKASTGALAARQQPAQRPTCMSVGGAFAPPQMARWRMIDDSDTGTLTSMSLSPSTPSDAMYKLLTGDSQRNLDTNGNNMNADANSSNPNEATSDVVSPVPKQGKTRTDRKPYSRIPNVGTSSVPSRLKRPSAGSTTTSSTNSSSATGKGQNDNNNKIRTQQAKQNSDHKPRRFVGGWFSKKLNSQESKSSQGQKEKLLSQKESKNKTNLSKSNTKEETQIEGKHVDSNLNEMEGSGEAMAEPVSDGVFADTSKKSEPKLGNSEVKEIKTEIIPRPTTFSATIPDAKTDNSTEKLQESPRKRVPSGSGHSHGPLARQESVDSTSICSLNSDDLMLDMDFDDLADQSLDRSALHQRLSRKTSGNESRGRLLSTEDDFPEADEADEPVEVSERTTRVVDKAVHAAVVSQISAAVPYTPSTPSVPSSPDVISSSTGGGPDSETVSPLANEVAVTGAIKSTIKTPEKPQSLNLKQPLVSFKGRTAMQDSATKNPAPKSSTSSTNEAPTNIPKEAVPVQRRSFDSARESRPRVNSDSDSHSSHSVQRRPRMRIDNRPASFHGSIPLADGDLSLPRPRTLRPPRQPSITDEDVEWVQVDGNSFRHMFQDLTTFKTHLLRLKRVIQEDEFSQSSKSGYKLGGSPVESPFGTSPEAAKLWSGAAMDRPDTSNVSLEDVLMENRELRVQLQFMQKQLEEHERTIKLLQQQMTKYECGLSGRDACRSEAATQTEKPRLAVSKGIVNRAPAGTGGGDRSKEGTKEPAAGASGAQQQGGVSAGNNPAVISSTMKTESSVSAKKETVANSGGKVNSKLEPSTRLPTVSNSRLRQPSRLKANGRPTNNHS